MSGGLRRSGTGSPGDETPLIVQEVAPRDGLQIEPAFVDHEFTLVVFGYVVMRVAMVAQWLRASGSAGDRRRTTRRAHPARPGPTPRHGRR